MIILIGIKFAFASRDWPVVANPNAPLLVSMFRCYCINPYVIVFYLTINWCEFDVANVATPRAMFVFIVRVSAMEGGVG